MKTVLICVFSGALMLGVAAAQDGATPAPPSSEPQTTSQAQAPQQAAPPASKSAGETQAPQPAANEGPANAPQRIAPGSVIPVSLTKTIDVKKVKTGDEVVAKVSQDLKTNTGQVVVAKDTKIVGHVTEAQARSKEQKESEIGIAFDRAVLKDGGDMQMPMSIQAIIGPQNNGPQNNGPQNNSAQNNQSSGGGGTGYGSQAGAGTGVPSSSGRSGGMSGGAPTNSPSVGSGTPSEEQGANARPPITAETQGVIGISDLKLKTAAPAANQGSLVSSEKNNVKLESGTMMLLRVNQ